MPRQIIRDTAITSQRRDGGPAEVWSFCRMKDNAMVLLQALA